MGDSKSRVSSHPTLSKILPLALRSEQGEEEQGQKPRLALRERPEHTGWFAFLPESVQATMLDGSKQQASSKKISASS